jgi:hypothetical protein
MSFAIPLALMVGAAAGGVGIAGALSPKPSPPSPSAMPPAAPQPKAVGEREKAQQDLRARLKRAQSRAASRVTEIGFLEEAPNVNRPSLSSLLG